MINMSMLEDYKGNHEDHRLPTNELKILHLHLKFEYFDAIKNGTKTEEYRDPAKWILKLDGVDIIRLYRGYTKASPETVMDFKWNGFELKTITHPHFGNVPKQVCAIDVTKRLDR